MEKLVFYDVKEKKKFESNKYVIKKKGNRKFAVTKAPSGIMAWRIVA